MQKADTIEFNEFQAALGRDGTFVTGRIFEVLDQNSNSEIDFREFVMGLSALSKRASLEEKIQCRCCPSPLIESLCSFIIYLQLPSVWCSSMLVSFKIYDIDNNGFIDKNELFQILKASLHDSFIDMTDEQMHSLVDSTFAECDTNHDDQISFDEYREMVIQHPSIAQFLTLPPELL